MTLTCFSELKLFSKKQYVFHDNIVNHAKIPLHILNLISLINMFNIGIKINVINNCICLFLSPYIADFISALFHCYYIDRDIFYKSKICIDNQTKKMIINTTNGYGSCHHMIPSNWKDIDDQIIIRDVFILLTPFFILNIFNPSNKTAYLIYAILYQLIFSGVTHKYAHEQNHNRYVPGPIKLLQHFGLALSGKNHKKHHEGFNCNYSFLNGLSNTFANLVINKIDKFFKVKPHEGEIEFCKKYVEKFGSDINIQFIGDIDGEIVCNLDGNTVKLKTNV